MSMIGQFLMQNSELLQFEYISANLLIQSIINVTKFYSDIYIR